MYCWKTTYDFHALLWSNLIGMYRYLYMLPMPAICLRVSLRRCLEYVISQNWSDGSYDSSDWSDASDSAHTTLPLRCSEGTVLRSINNGWRFRVFSVPGVVTDFSPNPLPILRSRYQWSAIGSHSLLTLIYVRGSYDNMYSQIVLLNPW
jgi:hypothetical protein